MMTKSKTEEQHQHQRTNSRIKDKNKKHTTRAKLKNKEQIITINNIKQQHVQEQRTGTRNKHGKEELHR
jgi:hypothetical protein